MVKRVKNNRFWQYLFLQIAGLGCCAVLIAFATLVWGYIVYSQLGYITGTELLSLYIFFGAVFISSCLITVLEQGGVIFPVILFSFLVNFVSFLLAEVSPLPIKGLLLKLGLSLLTAMVAFTLTKLLIIRNRRPYTS